MSASDAMLVRACRVYIKEVQLGSFNQNAAGGAMPSGLFFLIAIISAGLLYIHSRVYVNS